MPPCEDSVGFNLINKFQEDVSESKPSAFVFYNDDDDDDVFYQKDFDYKPPLTGMFVPPCLEMTTGSSDDKKNSVLVGVDKKNPDFLKFGDSYAVHKDIGTTVSSSEPKPHVRDPSWWFAYDSFGNEDEFDAFPRPRSSFDTAYCPFIRIDYIPPIAGMFVPPCLKAFVEEMTTGSSDGNNNKKNSFQVVVGNLPSKTRNPDLLELFQSFGHVISADVAVDQNSGCSGRFGFVNFATREAAQSAIERVNGIDYHNCVLRVEWPSPKTT